MSGSNVDVIRAGYAAHASRDFAGIFATLDPDITIWQTDELPWGGTYRGHEQARAFFMSLNQHLETQVIPEEYVEAGDQVAVIGRIRGQVRATGREYDLRIVHIWTIVNGLVTRFEPYIDTPAMLQALEHAE